MSLARVDSLVSITAAVLTLQLFI